jgi:hypothetical protein
LKEADVAVLESAMERFLSHGGLWMGDFVKEFKQISRKFICLSPRRYIHCFVNGEFKIPYGCKADDKEGYFERRYDRLKLKK